MANAIIERVGGVGVDCEDATATVAQVMTPYTFGGKNSEELQTGTMPNNGTVNYTITTNGGTFTPAEGYHSGSGKVTYSLPSVAGGTTYTPTASAHTVSLANKYLKSNISVAGSSNLVASNIVSGKTIWGKSGTFVNYATKNQVYNGSAFAGFLSAGVINYPTANGNRIRQADKQWCDKSANGAITSGSLYVTSTTKFSQTLFSFFVSAKSVDFSLFSTLRITGYFTATLYCSDAVTNAYVSLRIGAIERTNSGGSTSVLHTGSFVTDQFTYSGSEGSTGSGTVTFDDTIDISSWTGTTSFLEINSIAHTLSDNSTISWRGMTLVITGIYLS